MSEYCVNTEAQTESGDNEVHNVETCEHLPEPQNRKSLGHFDSCDPAVEKAKEYYPNTADGCYHCCEACHTK